MFTVHTIHIMREYILIRTVVPDALGGGVMSIYITDNRYSHRRPDYQFSTPSRVPIDLLQVITSVNVATVLFIHNFFKDPGNQHINRLHHRPHYTAINQYGRSGGVAILL